MEDNCVFDFFIIICSMNPETTVTFHHDHLNIGLLQFCIALCDRNRILSHPLTFPLSFKELAYECLFCSIILLILQYNTRKRKSALFRFRVLYCKISSIILQNKHSYANSLKLNGNVRGCDNIRFLSHKAIQNYRSPIFK